MSARRSPTARRSKRRRRIRPRRSSISPPRCRPGRSSCSSCWAAIRPSAHRSTSRFAERLAKVPLAVYHGLYADETANLAHWTIPELHPLECWGDARAYDGTVTMMQPLIAPLYEGHSAHELLSTIAGQPGRTQIEMVKDYWTRAFNGQGGWSFRGADGQPFQNADAFWTRTVHDGFIRGTSIVDGGPVTPFVPAPKAAATTTVTVAAAAGTPGARRWCTARCRRRRRRAGAGSSPDGRRCSNSARHAGSPGCGAAKHHASRCRRPRDHLPPGSDGVGRPLCQQRLAPGTAQAAHQDHLGHVGLDAPGARRAARPPGWRRRGAALPRQHHADADRPRRRPSPPVGHGVLRLRPAPGRPGRQRRGRGAAVQRLPAAHLGRPVVRHRSRDAPRPASATCWRRRRSIT